jgi:hypothetical protein
MSFSRRKFMKGAVYGLASLAGPWSVAGRKGHAATADTPALKFLTPSEYRYINKMAREIVPDEPVLTGRVDVGHNIDWLYAEDNRAPGFLVMMRLLRLIRLAGPVLPLLKRVAPPTHEDIISFKRTIVFLGYYSDANREADLPPKERVVWPRIGYGGPKPDDWWPPEQEDQLDRSLLVDRIEEEGA